MVVHIFSYTKTLKQTIILFMYF